MSEERAKQGQRLVRALLSCVAVAVVGIPLVIHTFHERRTRKDELERFRLVAQQLSLLAPHAGPNRRVFINGQPTFFGLRVSTGSVAATLDDIRRECANGDLGVRLEPKRAEESARPALSLVREDRQERTDDGALLCTFREPGLRGAGPVRYTFARKNEEGKTSVFTVSTESTTSFETLFPTTGDVPGGDLEGIPRPVGSRRTFAASIEGDSYAVRIYEVAGVLTDAVRDYDRRMQEAGWTRSEAVSAAMSDARAYSRGSADVVASFEPREGTVDISIAPLAGVLAPK